MAGLLDWVDPTRNAFVGLLRGEDRAGIRNKLVEALMNAPKPFDRSAIDGEAMLNNALNAGPSGLLGKIVYHGSPHKFDKFDASKIGTGEGAQAYGHGVYLADSENVAKGYREKLASGPNAARGRVKFDMETGTWIREPDGALYKADLPDEWIPKMLDWDKPLSKQKEVSAALDALQASPELPKGFGAAIAAARSRPHFDGNDLYRELVKVLPNDQVATVMNRAGFPGIRYLDGGSRGAGQGSYNYVVFPGLEDQVKILERNGQPLGLLGMK